MWAWEDLAVERTPAPAQVIYGVHLVVATGRLETSRLISHRELRALYDPDSAVGMTLVEMQRELFAEYRRRLHGTPPTDGGLACTRPATRSQP